VYRWRTLRTAIRNANCTTQWIIEILNAYCAAAVNATACLVECRFQTSKEKKTLNLQCFSSFSNLAIESQCSSYDDDHRLFKLNLSLRTNRNNPSFFNCPHVVHTSWKQRQMKQEKDCLFFIKPKKRHFFHKWESLENSPDRPRLRQDYPLNLSI